MLSTNNLPSNQIEAGSDNGGNVVFKQNISTASNNNNAKNMNAKAKGGSLMNVTICFLDESKTVLQVSVSFDFFVRVNFFIHQISFLKNSKKHWESLCSIKFVNL